MTKTGKILLISALSLILTALVFYCVRFGKTPEEKLAENPTVSAQDALQTAIQLSSTAETAWENGTAIDVTLADHAGSSSASGVQIRENIITITSSGIYRISGSLPEGQLVLDCDDTVALILDGVEISNSADAVICVSDAEHAMIYLPEGSENRLISGIEQQITAAGETADTESASGAALYARDSLSVAGSGKLTVGGYINNAVATTDHLIILGGELEVTAVNNGLKGKDSVTIADGTMTIYSGNDGIKSNNDTDTDCGNIDIRGGEINIISFGDGIHAENDLSVKDGVITVTASDTASGSNGESIQSFENLPGNIQEGMSGGSFESLQMEGITDNEDGSITVSAEAAEKLLSMAKEFFGSSDVSAEDITACTSYEELTELFRAEINTAFPGAPGETGNGSVPKMGETPSEIPNGSDQEGFPGNGDAEGSPDKQGNGMNPRDGTIPPEKPGFGTGEKPNGEMPQGEERDNRKQNDRNSSEKANQSADKRGQGGMQGDFRDSFDREWNYGSGSEVSAKGLKSGGNLTISGGNITVNSIDDCIHANASITVAGGTFLLTTGDDGFHADDTLTVSDGNITVTESYEGIEGHYIYLNGGNVSVTASDDGLNAGGESSFPFGAIFDRSVSEDTSLSILKINGGTLYINANGDGLDSNGDLIIEGGNIIVDGPTNSGNGALDSGSENGGRIICNGGTVLAIGASGMAESFENDSGQCSFVKNYAETLPTGTPITITDENGNMIFEYTSAKTFNSVVFSSPELILGNSYTVTVRDQTDTITMENMANGTSSGFGMPGGFGGKGKK